MDTNKDRLMVTVILEGGLVRDVLNVPDYVVLDLDVLEEGHATELREGFALAQQVLPLDYPDREDILGKIREQLSYTEWIAYREAAGRGSEQ